MDTRDEMVRTQAIKDWLIANIDNLKFHAIEDKNGRIISVNAILKSEAAKQERGKPIDPRRTKPL
jgi:hypothetical protein